MSRITQMTEGLPTWEKLLKRMVLEQLGSVQGIKILDFGSGIGVTAGYFAEDNEVIAVEPSEEMLALEMRVAELAEYKEIAFFHHLMLEKR